MADRRAAKSGFALDAQKKIDAKFDGDVAKQCLEWLKGVIGDDSMCTEGTKANVVAMLKDGIRLEKLQKKLKNPSCDVSGSKKPGMIFQWNERLSAFNAYLKDKEGVHDSDTFTPENLTEETNVPQVIICLQSIGRKCVSKAGIGGFGPKEAEANKREFSEAQLAEGKNVIGLQMGSNKGATQAGQNFGKGRMIVD